ncbi:hypothetical protein C8Q74DRAFT_1436406 [Fomes fomentarius]|nr:hypothetical protein C8Q74DRAFT_1436406 [Fomes fomentarius]
MVIRRTVQLPADPSLSVDYYPSLLACTLTCKSWLQASQRALYHTVRLRSYKSALFFIRTITENEWFASLVREVSIDPGARYMNHLRPSARSDGRPGRQINFGSYIPIVHGTLTSKLRFTRCLELRSLDMKRDYPPFFSRQLARFPGPMHELILWNCVLPLPQLFPLLWSLKELRRLSLVTDVPMTPASSLDCLKLQHMQAVRPRACSQLRELELGGWYICMDHFPPPGAFGQSIIELSLRVQLCIGNHAVENLTVLKSLKVTVTMYPLDTSPAAWKRKEETIQEADRDRYQSFISNILNAIPLPTSLESLTFAWRFSVLRVRSEMLGVLFGSHSVRESVRRFPNLKRFTVDLEEPAGGCSTHHWKTLLTNLLPREVHGCIMVKISVVHSISRKIFWMDDLCTVLNSGKDPDQVCTEVE